LFAITAAPFFVFSIDGIDYAAIPSLRIEAAQKPEKIRPASMDGAARISGVSPADIMVPLI